MSDEKPMGQVIQIDEARIRDHLDNVRKSFALSGLAASSYTEGATDE